MIEWRFSLRTIIKLVGNILTLAVLLVIGLSAAAKTDGSQSEIPFVVTNQQATSQCVRCVGPLFRDTGSQEVPPLASMQEIFSARVTGLSPFGGWTCRLMEFDADAAQCTSKPVNAADFCLRENSKSVPVALNIENDGTLGTNQPQNCKTDSANVAFLGNHRRFGMPDKDTYLFNANAGNTVIAFLEPEAKGKKHGKSAVLGLRYKNRTTGTTFKKVVRGSLPLRIEATVPETGAYELFVAQRQRRRRASFRGFYHLSTRGNILAPRLRNDQDAIEPVVAGEPLSPLPQDAGCYRTTIQTVFLEGDLKVVNKARFPIKIKILRNGVVLANTHIDPNISVLFRDPGDADEGSSDLTPNPFTIDLEAVVDGVFEGSTRLQLEDISNQKITMFETPDCN